MNTSSTIRAVTGIGALGVFGLWLAAPGKVPIKWVWIAGGIALAMMLLAPSDVAGSSLT